MNRPNVYSPNWYASILNLNIVRTVNANGMRTRTRYVADALGNIICKVTRHSTMYSKMLDIFAAGLTVVRFDPVAYADAIPVNALFQYPRGVVGRSSDGYAVVHTGSGLMFDRFGLTLEDATAIVEGVQASPTEGSAVALNRLRLERVGFVQLRDRGK